MNPEQAETNLRARYGLRDAPPDLADPLALVARWFFSRPRDGVILFREADWPYRQILRACARLLSPPSSPLNFTHRRLKQFQPQSQSDAPWLRRTIKAHV